MITRFDKNGKVIKKKDRIIDYSYKPEADPNRDYRSEELTPAAAELLEKARKKRGVVYIQKSDIDFMVEHQHDIDYLRRWVCWKFIGSMNYSQAFIEPEKDENESAIKNLQLQINEMQAKLDILINISMGKYIEDNKKTAV